MNKELAIEWLNHRKDLANTGRLLAFDNTDITFIRNYIHHYKGQLIDPMRIVEAITGSHPEEVMARIDFICNKLIEDFKITMTTTKKMVQNPQFFLSIGESPFTRREIEFVESYS